MDQIRIVFLGTSSASPSRDRNVSSVAVVLDGRALLFDCGEGTQHQLLRAPVRSSAIDSIFISHLHGDHVYGVPGLLATLSLNGRSAPLEITGPEGTVEYIESALRTTWHNPAFELVIRTAACEGDEAHVLPPAFVRDSKRASRVLRPQQALGFHVRSALLDHSVPSYGYCIVEDDLPGKFDLAKARESGVPEGPLFGRLQHGEAVRVGERVIEPRQVVGPPRPGRRIAYCTDTRPCAAAVELARGADLLVHESTYAGDMAADAAERFHSTATEAARVAAEAGVRRLVLTHFSTRYEDVTPLLSEARAVFPNTDAASDLGVFDVPRT